MPSQVVVSGVTIIALANATDIEFWSLNERVRAIRFYCHMKVDGSYIKGFFDGRSIYHLFVNDVL